MTQINAQAHFQRAMILHQQRRFADAEAELRQGLAGDPSNARMHAMLGLCLAGRKQYMPATEEAQQAVGLEPDLPFTHYALAAVMIDRERYKEALASIEQAIALDSSNAAYYGLLASVRMGLRDWPRALQAADVGLQLDPENERCVNLRAMALVKLGRKREAGQAIGAALEREPENALTHANQGWTLLHQNDHRRAMHHFREALRLDPQMEWAKAGMVESLKARNPLYRVMLAYFLWMTRLGPQAQWGIILGGYFGSQLLASAAEQNPALAPLALPLFLLYALFALLTWIAAPLFNLLLRLDRFGRYALSRDQTAGANCLAIVLLGAVGLGVAAWQTSSPPLAYAALGVVLLSIPVTTIFKLPQGWPRWVMIAYTAGLLILGGLALRSALLPNADGVAGLSAAANQLRQAYIWGILLCQFLANALMGVTVRK